MAHPLVRDVVRGVLHKNHRKKVCALEKLYYFHHIQDSIMNLLQELLSNYYINLKCHVISLLKTRAFKELFRNKNNNFFKQKTSFDFC